MFRKHAVWCWAGAAVESCPSVGPHPIPAAPDPGPPPGLSSRLSLCCGLLPTRLPPLLEGGVPMAEGTEGAVFGKRLKAEGALWASLGIVPTAPHLLTENRLLLGFSILSLDPHVGLLLLPFFSPPSEFAAAPCCPSPPRDRKQRANHPQEKRGWSPGQGVKEKHSDH